MNPFFFFLRIIIPYLHMVRHQAPAVVCLLAKLSMFLLCGDDDDAGGGVSPSPDTVIFSCTAEVFPDS